MGEMTRIVSTHWFRRVARDRERELQALLDRVYDGGVPDPTKVSERVALRDARVPEWARGVRVEKAGMLQYAVVATEHKGH